GPPGARSDGHKSPAFDARGGRTAPVDEEEVHRRHSGAPPRDSGPRPAGRRGVYASPRSHVNPDGRRWQAETDDVAGASDDPNGGRAGPSLAQSSQVEMGGRSTDSSRESKAALPDRQGRL